MPPTDQERWHAAAHALQSGVAAEHGFGSQDGSPKHLRVGVNIALRDHASLVQLMISKGVFTSEEYAKAIADGLEEEVRALEERLSATLGRRVTLA